VYGPCIWLAKSGIILSYPDGKILNALIGSVRLNHSRLVTVQQHNSPSTLIVS